MNITKSSALIASSVLMLSSAAALSLSYTMRAEVPGLALKAPQPAYNKPIDAASYTGTYSPRGQPFSYRMFVDRRSARNYALGALNASTYQLETNLSGLPCSNPGEYTDSFSTMANNSIEFIELQRHRHLCRLGNEQYSVDSGFTTVDGSDGHSRRTQFGPPDGYAGKWGSVITIKSLSRSPGVNQMNDSVLTGWVLNELGMDSSHYAPMEVGSPCQAIGEYRDFWESLNSNYYRSIGVKTQMCLPADHPNTTTPPPAQ